VAKPSIFTEREAAFLRALVRQKVDFIIVGLSAATLQGAPAVTQDIDLWFRDLGQPGLRKALDKVGGIYVPATTHTPPRLAGDAVALFDIVTHMHGLEAFETEAARAVRVRLGGVTVNVLPLERIIASKEALNRPKDRRSLDALRNAVLAARSRRRPGSRRS
jgi:predicted nucleotidyltransferase